MKRFLLPLTSSLLAAGMAAGTASAADLSLDAFAPAGSEIPPAPIELGVSPPPMVLLMLDDSLSMSSNLLMPDASNGARLSMGGLDYAWTFPLPTDAPASDSSYTNAHLHRLAAPRRELVNAWNAGGFTALTVGRNLFGGRDLDPSFDDAWKAYSPDFNSQYYNPTTVYEPWEYGVDNTGAPFVDATAAAARLDPYDPTAGTINLLSRHTVDLPVIENDGSRDSARHVNTCALGSQPSCDFRFYVPHYYQAVDSDGDGDIDDDDTPLYVEITDAAGLQNFANWFQYHRSRAHSAKAALATFMANVGSIYMGTAGINGTAASMVEVAQLNSDETSGHRRAIMDAIFVTRGTAAGTPLRTALDDAKDYFACGGSNLYGNTNCPRLADADEGSCQQAATILVTDGFDTADGTALTSTGTPGAHGAAGSNHTVSNSLSGPAAGNTDGDDNTEFDGGTYADSFSGTLADVAMDAYERDLDASYESRQFMETFVLHLGVTGTVSTPGSSAGTFAWPNPTHGAGDFQTVHLIDDLTHAAFNGRGRACAASDDNLVSKFRSALNLSAGTSQGTASIGIETGAILDDQQVFLASFDTEEIVGDLEAFDLEADGSLGSRNWSAADRLDTDLAGTGWEDRLVLTLNPGTRQGMRFDYAELCASRNDQLTALALDTQVRQSLDGIASAADNVYEILNLIDESALLSQTVKDAFATLRDNFLDQLLNLVGTETAALSSETESVLCSGTDADGDGDGFDIDASVLLGLTRNLSEAQVNYIRGDRSQEQGNGGSLRDRSSLMGPIYRSQPIFVGPPSFDYPDQLEGTSDAASYSAFRTAHANRRKMVYVGANDGMLHGFDAETGEELLAYVPAEILGRIGDITDPAYEPAAFVDGEISVVDAYDSFPACPSGEKCWRTILVGGLRGGGQAFYALDVTEPGEFVTATTDTQKDDLAAEIVLWEFGDSPSGVGINGLALNAKFLVQGILTDGLYDFLGGLEDPNNLDNIVLNAVQAACNELLFFPLDAVCAATDVAPIIAALPVLGPIISDLVDVADPLTGLDPVLPPVTDLISDQLDTLIPSGEQFGHPDMGYSFARPNINRLADGRWAAILPNGYHSTDVDVTVADDSDPSLLGLGVSVTGNAVLYVVDLATGAINQTGFAGVFDTGVGNWIPPVSSLNATPIPIDVPDPVNPTEAQDYETNDGRPNGLADPAPVDIDGDVTIDRIYAGDERGNLWRIDTTDSDSTNWDFAFKLISDNRPLFNSSINANRLQSITTRPEVGLHPVSDILVLFGTGKFQEVEDLNTVDEPDQSFYAIWDKFSAGTQPTIDRADLLEQTIEDEQTVTADFDEDGVDETRVLRVTSNEPINYRNDFNTGAGTHLGWYIDLVVDGASSNEGERIFGDPNLRNGQITFATVLPSDSQCAFEGSSIVYRLESASGGRPFVAPIDQTIDGIFANAIATDAISEVPTVLLTEDGREVTLQRNDEGSVDAVYAEPGGFERQRATWRELR